jgi:hypothetical protein
MQRYLAFFIFTLFFSPSLRAGFKGVPEYALKGIAERYKWAKHHLKREGSNAFADIWLDGYSPKAKQKTIQLFSAVNEAPNLIYFQPMGAFILETRDYMLVIQDSDHRNGHYLFNGRKVILGGDEASDNRQILRILKHSRKSKSLKTSAWSILQDAYAADPAPKGDWTNAEEFRKRVNVFVKKVEADVQAEEARIAQLELENAQSGQADIDVADLYEGQRTQLKQMTELSKQLQEKIKASDEAKLKELASAPEFSSESLDPAKGDVASRQSNLYNAHARAGAATPEDGSPVKSELPAAKDVDYATRFEGEGVGRAGLASHTANAHEFADQGAVGKRILELLSKPEYQKTLLEKPIDNASIAYFCKNFNNMPAPEKVKFWLAFMDALSFAESGHRLNDSYKEDDGNISAGLFSMSTGDHWRGPDCKKISSNVHGMIENLDCAMQTMSNQLRDTGRLTFSGAPGSKVFKKDFYYWSVLSPNIHAPGRAGNLRLKNRWEYLKTKNKVPAACNG